MKRTRVRILTNFDIDSYMNQIHKILSEILKSLKIIQIFLINRNKLWIFATILLLNVYLKDPAEPETVSVNFKCSFGRLICNFSNNKK